MYDRIYVKLPPANSGGFLRYWLSLFELRLISSDNYLLIKIRV